MLEWMLRLCNAIYKCNVLIKTQAFPFSFFNIFGIIYITQLRIIFIIYILSVSHNSFE